MVNFIILKIWWYLFDGVVFFVYICLLISSIILSVFYLFMRYVCRFLKVDVKKYLNMYIYFRLVSVFSILLKEEMMFFFVVIDNFY